MRITSGTAKGFIIEMPAGPKIRPTLDITRKAVFDIIGEDIRDAKFLDLFAGTGASGIEALSRGAASAVFVDCSAFCIKAIKENLIRTSLFGYAKLIRRSVFDLLCQYDKQKEMIEDSFDIVFADPPYHKNIREKHFRIEGISRIKVDSQAKMTLHLLSSGAILNCNSKVIIEHSSETEMPDSKGILNIWKQRRYGSTMVSIYRKG